MFFFGMMFALFVSVITYALYVLVFSFTTWMAVDAGKQDRFLWVLIILGLPVVGPVIYFFVEKKHEYKRAPVHRVHKSETEEQHEKAPETKE
jgi:hypothetical protein